MRFEQLVDVVSSTNTAVRIDSRLVENGDAFVAVPGSACDGHDFIDSALLGTEPAVHRKRARDIRCVVVEFATRINE